MKRLFCAAAVAGCVAVVVAWWVTYTGIHADLDRPGDIQA